MAITDVLRSLSAPVQMGRFSSHNLFQRWYGTLVSCLPVRLRRFLARREDYLIVVPQGATARVLEIHGDEQVPLGQMDPNIPGSLGALLHSGKSASRKTVIRLAQDRVLRREAFFPVQTRNDLAQVLSYEMDRLSPFQPDEVYFDFRTLEVPAHKDKIRIELALCRRDQVRDWLKWLRDTGARVDRVTWDGAWPLANLLPTGERPTRSAGYLSVNKLLALLVFMLLAAALASPIWQMQQIRDQHKLQISELKIRAEKVQEIRSALERARQGSVAVLQRKWEQPRIIDLLLELTEHLPDDTWVQNLNYQDGEIQIRGESAQATALINLLDKAPGITEVTFRSPVVQVAGTGRERFHISLKYSRPEGS